MKLVGNENLLQFWKIGWYGSSCTGTVEHYKKFLPMFLIFIVDSSIQGTIVNSYILVCPSTNKAAYFYKCRDDIFGIGFGGWYFIILSRTTFESVERAPSS